MLIKEKALQHWIDHFYGYGSWQARVWFVAHEETGIDLPEEVAERIDYFFDVHAGNIHPTLCDIRALYRNVAFRVDGPRGDLFKTQYDYRFDNNAVLHGTWKNLIAFVHGYQNKELPDLLAYQKQFFVLPSPSNEALIRLYPLPAHDHAWYYSWLDLPPSFGFLKTRALYQEHLFQYRLQHILRNISTHKPEVVLMYSMENINTLKRSIQDLFPSAKFKMISAIKQVIPQHHRADLGGTTILITTQRPALRHNRIETGFDWQELGRRC